MIRLLIGWFKPLALKLWYWCQVCVCHVYSLFVPLLVAKVRRRDKIRVTFVLADLGAWKSENLYHAMCRHDRFEPTIVVVPVFENPGGKQILLDYLESAKIPFFEVSPNDFIGSVVASDIIIYQKPYHTIYYPKHRYSRNLGSLFCYVPYALRSVVAESLFNLPLLNIAWQVYFENKDCVAPLRLVMSNGARNSWVTGTPTQDELRNAMSNSKDPWVSTGKKRIIYAPHFSIPVGDRLLAYSTFLDYADFMLELAEKYKDRVLFAFKPHPLLQSKLNEFWGEERTAAYYEAWNRVGQLELGKYYGLFAHSDAMVHDCGSFTLEYLYAQKPVMYLAANDEEHCNDMNQMSIDAYNLHYKGRCKEDIERFVKDVIAGHDPLAESRKSFFSAELIPPYGKSACQNIINAILGEGEFEGK